MSKGGNEDRVCTICRRSFGRRQLTPGFMVRDSLSELLQRDHPAWSPDGFICRDDLTKIRALYVHELLASEKGELTTLEEDVMRSLREHEILSANVEDELQQGWSLGERLADRIAEFGGSWTFLVCFFLFLASWIALNTIVLATRPLDPYPFILLNLVLSCLAAIQAPIIMMSQNRQEAKDRLRSQHDYKVNLKAELEIRHLHEKLDHLLSHQWDRLLQIQELQIELISELGRKR
jgi:uncharacterized membrane protein